MSDFYVKVVIDTSNGAEITLPFDIEHENDASEAEAAVRELLTKMNIQPMYIEIS